MNRKFLSPKDRDILEDLISRDVNDLNEENKAVIRARWDYLTQAEKDSLEKFFKAAKDKTFKELKEEAKQLGIAIPTAISKDNLKIIIDEEVNKRNNPENLHPSQQ